jgi:riboflavin transporter FmnP
VDTKKLTFIIMMGALGNVLFVISYLTGQIAPGVAFDFSLIAVLIAGFFAGPKAGFITGLIAGIVPGIMYGPAGNAGILGLIGLPLGKSFTGLTSGLLSNGIKLDQKPRKALLAIPLTLASYIPEGLFTYAYFTSLLPLFTASAPLAEAIVSAIMIKAVVEVVIMSFIIAALLGNKGFNDFVRNFHYRKPQATVIDKTAVTK